MPPDINGNGKNSRAPASSGTFGDKRWIWVMAGLAALLALGAAGMPGLQQPPDGNQQSPNMGRNVDRSAANRLPDANTQMAMRCEQARKMNVEAASVERKRQITDDSALLLKLATDLKAEVDKTGKDTLSLGVIRKADEIERLAHAVKEKMKLTMNTTK